MPLHLDAGLSPIAGYTLVRLLGRGGFGEVWEANAPGDFRVALKFVRLDTHEASLEQRALEVIRSIRHPHLLDVQFAAQVDDCLVIAMPLCDESLLDRLRACQAEGHAGLPRGELFGYMAELARAVDFLNEPRHRAADGSLVGVQHRDIKPHNIFLVGGSARLADFGLAKVPATSGASHTGSMSPYYVAPEAIEGRVSRHADQYSLAVSYFQLRTGRLPFEGESVIQIINAHLHTAPDLASLPAKERPVVARALAKRPEERWPSCLGFVRALVAASRNEGGRQAAGGGSNLAPGDLTEDQAGLATGSVSRLPEAQPSPSAFPTLIVDESSSGVRSRTAGSFRRQRRIKLVVLVLGLGVLAIGVVIVISRRGPIAEGPPLSTPGLTRRGPITKGPPLSMPSPNTFNPADVAGLETITNMLGMKLVLIPAGEFLMGSPDSDKDAAEDEMPQHRVRVTRPFYLGAHEVTRGQYRDVTSDSPSHFKTWDDLPVTLVSWDDAIAFCNKLSVKERLAPYYRIGGIGDHRTVTIPDQDGVGYRLPTEAEWEYACRAGSTTRYHFGDDAASLDEYAWYSANSEKQTRPVGRKRSNAWGLYDMHGNVFEWCWDWYNADYYGQSPGVDPLGPSQAQDRVLRSGSGRYRASYARSAYRRRHSPGDRYSVLGFRVARGQSSR